MFLFVLIALLFINLIIHPAASAKDLGVRGQIYPIVESNLIDEIKIKVLSHTMDVRNLYQERLQQIDRPKPIKGLTRTEKPHTWLFKPTLKLSHDLTNAEDQVIALAGTEINPLHTVALPYVLILYNGDDKQQVEWVRHRDTELKGQDKLILVGGSVIEQMQLFKKSVFFDQGGLITEHFQLKHMPVQIQQRDQLLQIEEIKI